MIKPKILDWDTGLKVRALFTLASDLYKYAGAYESMIADMLGLEDGRYCGRLSDAMIDGDKGFDQALKAAGFIIAKPKKTSRRKKHK